MYDPGNNRFDLIDYFRWPLSDLALAERCNRSFKSPATLAEEHYRKILEEREGSERRREALEKERKEKDERKLRKESEIRKALSIDFPEKIDRNTLLYKKDCLYDIPQEAVIEALSHEKLVEIEKTYSEYVSRYVYAYLMAIPHFGARRYTFAHILLERCYKLPKEEFSKIQKTVKFLSSVIDQWLNSNYYYNRPLVKERIKLIENEALSILKEIDSASIDFIFVEPPPEKAEIIDDYREWLTPHIEEAHRVLKPKGSLFFKSDFLHLSHYCKVWLDEVFGCTSFKAEIATAYNHKLYPRRDKGWDITHSNIFWYAKNPQDYTYQYYRLYGKDVASIQWAVPGKEQKVKHRNPSVWWYTPDPTEKKVYPEQEQLFMLENLIKAHTEPEDIVLDFFAGSGTTGEAAATLQRRAILIDNNPQAIDAMRKRFSSRFLREDWLWPL